MKIIILSDYIIDLTYVEIESIKFILNMGNCSSFCQQCKAKTAGKNYLTEELKVPSEHFSKYVLNIDLNNEEESKHIDNMLNAILPGKGHLILSNTSICRQVNMKL